MCIRDSLSILCDAEPFDVAILDAHMPEIHGFALASEIRTLEKHGLIRRRESAATASYPLLPLIMLTSMGKSDFALQGEPVEVIALINKPVKQLQLYNLLLRVVNGGIAATEPAPSSDSSMGLTIAKTLTPTPNGTASNLSSLRILLAEDNVVNQKVALHLLQRLGCRADVAGNGLEVLEALHRQPYDVVLMDVQMPEMDGLTATRHICQKWSPDLRPRIVAMTANAMQGDRESCLQAGMDDYISKPIRIEELTHALSWHANTPPLNPSIILSTPALEPVPVAAPVGDAIPALPQPAVTAVEFSDSRSLPNSITSEDAAAIIDVKALQVLHNLSDVTSQEFLDEMIDSYLEDAARLVRTMVEAIVTGNTEGVRSAAHTLKSSSATLGALNFAKLCQHLETLVRSGEPIEHSQYVPRLQQEYQQVQSALKLHRLAAKSKKP